jgi:DNA-binding LacI/PurR family transcriptional regulator
MSLDAATDSENQPDLDVRNEGTIIVFTPQTEAGKHFLQEVLYTDSYQWFGGALCIDHRMARGVIDAAKGEGLTVGFLDDPTGLAVNAGSDLVRSLLQDWLNRR